MYYVITALILVVSVLLILVVLVQNSKGGGLAANFAGGQQVMGVRRTTDFLEKATWTLAVAVLLLSFAAVAFMTPGDATNEDSLLRDKVENAGSPMTAPFEEE
ncbi:hypothetical protein AGMMS4956_17690 [Bacteroidia bacterium]|nr:hypothetical protein AGMMS4956_17690 [Bacteroidia bacterium]